MQAIGTFKTRVEYVGKLILYVKPDGTLIVSTGNQRLEATSEEVHELVDYFMLFANRFSNGYLPPKK